jgi:hypothetical protein
MSVDGGVDREWPAERSNRREGAFDLARFSNSNFHIIVRMVCDRTYVRFSTSYKMFGAERQEEKSTRPQQSGCVPPMKLRLTKLDYRD